MSTYIHLYCVTHGIEAVDESGQHLYDLPRIRDEIVHRDELVSALKENPYAQELRWSGTPQYDSRRASSLSTAYFSARSAWFLAAHPDCQIGIRDEGGPWHPAHAGEVLESDYELCPNCNGTAENNCPCITGETRNPELSNPGWVRPNNAARALALVNDRDTPLDRAQLERLLRPLAGGAA